VVSTATPVASAPQPSADEVPQCLYFFYRPGCESCDEAGMYISQVQLNFTLLDVHAFALDNESNVSLLQSFYSFHNISSFTYPVVFIGNKVLMGVYSIEDNLVPLLENNTGWVCPSYNSTIPPYNSSNISTILPVILGMAFADSLNPCAIAVLLLLIMTISLASVSIWRVGLAYILGNFVAYLLIGFGLFTILQQFSLPTYTSKVIGLLAIAVAVISLYSKLPSPSVPVVKKLITSTTSPIIAFAIGAVISAIELPCTGGPYFLTLTLMSLYNLTQAQTVGYLLIYNTIFVLPLVVVLLLYHFAQSPKIPRQYIRYISAAAMLVIGVILLLL
jgi:cytochrome c biogenesis protein CcdA